MHRYIRMNISDILETCIKYRPDKALYAIQSSNFLLAFPITLQIMLDAGFDLIKLLTVDPELYDNIAVKAREITMSFIIEYLSDHHIVFPQRSLDLLKCTYTNHHDIFRYVRNDRMDGERINCHNGKQYFLKTYKPISFTKAVRLAI